MPRAPKTPRNQRDAGSSSTRTRRRPHFEFGYSEDRQILLAYLSLVSERPDMREVYRILANEAYSLGQLKYTTPPSLQLPPFCASKSIANAFQLPANRKQVSFLHEMSRELRNDRMQRKEHSRLAAEAGDESDSDSGTVIEAPTPSQSSETSVSMTPETPAYSRHHQVRDATPVGQRHEARSTGRRGRARDSGPEPRRGVSTHNLRRQTVRDNYRSARDVDDRPRGNREDALPPRQPLRGRRESARSSRDQGRNRSSPTPGPAFHIPVMQLRPMSSR
ncbi:hypothetical protein P170DRAFT_513285 [Aspergillus steynii IBT 23096]|uniref:Uncharacterized protein n=1 Tax=Aspergillus steynii IBT 23096 TaxID=1392250 RepID=A0A2I2FX90_9EURO|nr:uncharacterized protein P170DRAFT_513285 [Aspergillus steynii IBT 23096]PLB45258.1 hypothetical protein P170DRAFT_513285 [Aspergillus steynii IBT 23096]